MVARMTAPPFSFFGPPTPPPPSHHSSSSNDLLMPPAAPADNNNDGVVMMDLHHHPQQAGGVMFHPHHHDDDGGQIDVPSPPRKRHKPNQDRVLVFEVVTSNCRHNHFRHNHFGHDTGATCFVRPEHTLHDLYRLHFQSKEQDWWQIYEWSTNSYYFSDTFDAPISVLAAASKVGSKVLLTYGKILVSKVILRLQQVIDNDPFLAMACPRIVPRDDTAAVVVVDGGDESATTTTTTTTATAGETRVTPSFWNQVPFLPPAAEPAGTAQYPPPLPFLCPHPHNGGGFPQL